MRVGLPSDLHWFKGHFHSAPVLPGVVQLDWAIRWSSEAFFPGAVCRGVRALKFQKITTPGQILDVDIAWNPETSVATFEFRSELGRHASGRLEFEGAGSA